jgi:hypothetical protein
MGNIWNKDQVELILKCLLFRTQNSPDKIEIERKGVDVRFRNKYDMAKGLYKSSSEDNTFTVTLTDRSDQVFITLGGHSDSFVPSVWWWKDKEIKELVSKLLLLGEDKLSVTTQAIHKSFPESTTIEFEKAFLEGK